MYEQSLFKILPDYIDPKVLKKKTRQSKTTRASEVIQAITVKKKEVDRDIPRDNPFNPSITLN